MRPRFVIKEKDFLADLETPVSLYLRTARASGASFLLESVEQGETLGRYSFMGFDPEEIFELHPDHWKVRSARGTRRLGFKDPLQFLERELAAGRGLSRGLEYPKFMGGLVGFFSYEAVQFFECLRPRRRKERPRLPLAVFFKVHRFIRFDHRERTMRLTALYPAELGAKKIESRFRKETHLIQRLLERPLADSPKEREVLARIRPNMSRREFVKSVNRIKDYIKAGDIIQAVFSQRFDLGRMTSGFDFYRRLRSLNPSPYMFLFKYRGLELAGSSPEMLVRKQGPHAELRPIAGTRPRGRTEKEDLKLELQLRRSVKERAEHLMLVDLARNDVGRVSIPSSVKVRQYERVERYSHVMHLVSDVVGTLRKDCTALDLLRSVFPAGTLTGAPKVRAMEIIDELEPSERGPYGGCLGYLSYNGDMDMCITIRTLIKQRERASVQAGAGIVFDSDPGREYKECLNKARALFKAFRLSCHDAI